MSELRYETFRVSAEPGTIDPRGAEFVAAIDHGFLGRPRSEDLVISQLDRFRADGTLLSVVHDDTQDPRSVGADRPVATFGDFPGTVCVRDGVVLPASMITEVTVRGTHRRRGILSRLMRTALHRAADDGFALAALTASEGGIYGRFGFGAAAYGTAITVRTHHGLRLRPSVRAAIEAAGLQVILPSWDAYAAAYAAVYPRFQQRTVGQIGATEAFRRRARGDANGWALPGVDLHVRPSLVIDATGDVQGFALATPAEGRRLDIVDLGAATPLAQLALWDSLAATDLIDELTWRESAVDTPLRWALSDGRDLTTGPSGDRLWLRLLDLRAAYAARGLAGPGTVVFDVVDDEDLIGGTWTVRMTDTGVAEVTQGGDDEGPRLRIDPESLASLYLGAVDVRTLVVLGRAAAAPEHVSELARLLAPGVIPRNTYSF